jgi:hypothetical protein
VLGPYREGVLEPYREVEVNTLNGMQKRVTVFEKNINELVLETLAQRIFIALICHLFKAYINRRVWKAMGDRLVKSYYLSMGDYSWKIKTRKQRTDVGKYSFVNRIIKCWIQLPAR